MTTFNDFLTLEDSVTGAGLALTAQVPSDGEWLGLLGDNSSTMN